MPGRAQNARTLHELTVMVPHELLAKELDTYDVMESVRRFEETAPPSYWCHPIKQEALPEEVTIPVAIFVDAVEYSRSDSLVGISMTNLLTGRKFIIGTIRKKFMCGEACNCFCSNWCSLFCVYDFLRWSLEAMASGHFPVARHSLHLVETEGGWSKGDEGRAGLAGKPLGFKALCLQLRGDLAEYCHGFGFTSWASQSTPCIFCNVCKSELYHGLQTEDAAPPLKRDTQYAMDLQRAIVDVPMNQALWEEIQVSLKNHKESGGRILVKNFPQQGLQKGARMEPTQYHYDVWQGAMPTQVRFWHFVKPAISPKHENPMLRFDLGTCMSQCALVDIMHCWCLGIFQNFLHQAFWALDSKVFGGRSRAENGARLGQHLTKWYRQFQRDNPNIAITKLPSFSLKHTLGETPEKGKFRAKAHETLGLLRYSVTALEEFVGELENGDSYLACAIALLAMYTTLGGAPRLVPEDVQQ
eukprot:6486650-Amphidinium_carterae.1